jgi:hypothetical protein
MGYEEKTFGRFPDERSENPAAHSAARHDPNRS